MTKVRPISVESSDWEQARRVVGQFTRDVRDALVAERGGVRWADNISQVYEVDFNKNTAPLVVRTGLTSRPLSVVLLSAYNSTTNQYISGSEVTWSWDDGAVNLIDISGLAAATDYQVRFGVWES